MTAQHGFHHPQSRPDIVKHADPDPIAYEAQVYQRGLKYQRPPFTFKPLEWEALAAERMSADARGYVLGCAGTGETARRNRESFGKWGFVPRRLGLGLRGSSVGGNEKGVNDEENGNGKGEGEGEGKRAEDAGRKVFPNLRVDVLGRNLPCPIACAPVGVQKIMNPDGEVAAARAAAREGVPFIMSTASSTSIEDVARASDAGAEEAGYGKGEAERWFQLYWPAREHDDVTISLLGRAKKAGFTVLVVTLDTYILGWRPSDMDNGYNPFLRSDQIGIAIGLSDPVFTSNFQRKHNNRSADQDLGAAAAEWTRTIFPGAEHTLADIAFLRAHWGDDAPIVLKGVQSADDARLIAQSGLVDGIVVSNHGGRQADGGISSLGALPRIVEAVDAVNDGSSKGGGEGEGAEEKKTRRKVEVLFDSGIRSGADIAKALALGAKMCLIGRPYVYGLALGGEEGVAHVLRSLLGDLELTLHLSGIRSVGEEDLNRGCLVREDELF
ncbi:putative FMN dependent dehydrogenase [Annulohypoxylon truncatum]|uniref:putative FMN dependent dehydrogenase n=1 Tax=Annulohypoxylon truncatum TaxID=327061 RepID=UPI00200771D4|nr:putative FMN dependent dehydrogenase [Annulohypoxylon truncatum]KAI1214665.1 putative FMN dependent dehydrogenase [Annulohypoxylon truncatum]